LEWKRIVAKFLQESWWAGTWHKVRKGIEANEPHWSVQLCKMALTTYKFSAVPCISTAVVCGFLRRIFGSIIAVAY